MGDGGGGGKGMGGEEGVGGGERGWRRGGVRDVGGG